MKTYNLFIFLSALLASYSNEEKMKLLPKQAYKLAKEILKCFSLNEVNITI